MRALMVTKFVPLPANAGGRQRSLAILRRLADRGEVTLCAFDDGHGDLEGLRRMGVRVRCAAWHPTPVSVARGVSRTASLSCGRFWAPPLAAQVRAAAGDGPLDLLQVEYLQMTPYARGVSSRLRILDLHNVESDLTASYAASRGRLRRLPFRAEARALARLERRVLPRFDLVTVVSRRDRGLLTVDGVAPVVCPNGWEPGAPLPFPPDPMGEPVAVFVATMSWAPNEDAALWLAREVWPAVLARVPRARLLLVGRDPSPAVRALAGERIEVTGTVREIEPHLRRARLAVAPLRAGGGSRLKILEALSAGRPVVATTVGASGLEDLIGRGVVVADGAAGLAAAIADALLEDVAAADLGLQGHRAVADRYSWDAVLRPWLAALPS